MVKYLILICQSDAPMSINHTDQATKNVATFNGGYLRHEQAIILVLQGCHFISKHWGGHGHASHKTLHITHHVQILIW